MFLFLLEIREFSEVILFNRIKILNPILPQNIHVIKHFCEYTKVSRSIKTLIVSFGIICFFKVKIGVLYPFQQIKYYLKRFKVEQTCCHKLDSNPRPQR